VDLALANGGPVFFGAITFQEIGDNLPVGWGLDDLEVVLAGADSVVFDVSDVRVRSAPCTP
jgi:hypothetical protein